MNALDSLRICFEEALADARRVYEENKDGISGAFASGRYDGLKQAIGLLDQRDTRVH